MNIWRCLTLAALGFTGCAHIVPQQPTSPAPPPPPRITVADIPGVDDKLVFGPWNEMAGYELFGPGPDSDVAIVAFTPMFIGDSDVRTPAGVIGMTIFYDPTMPESLMVFVWQHELGHIIWGNTWHPDFDDVERGVMSACGFWTDRPGWFGPADLQRLRDAGY